ncbi:LysR substrate-binding domain-containing protein [Oryzibacter oryziterrae]|uniref:LysR substrate-binding domain-containing protein n=1 Tax=Oryzibacter oryziterrae TaxID=2766474 RepID=UPI001F2919A4|nr:LysR substrate-binding domain-containing protein [Oryzibacter oryziterrae]
MVMNPAIKLRHIRLFLQIADTGSLSAAARAQSLSQPAASKSLGELEALIGAELFSRSGRRLTLTAEGEQVRRHAREALASLDAAARAVLPGSERQVLSVGLLPTVSTRFFPEVAGRFIADRPDVTLSIETGTHPYLLAKLRNRDIDLMIGRMPQAGELTGLDFEFLYDEPIIAVVRSGHPLEGAPIDEIIRRAPLVLPNRFTVIRKMIDDFLGARGLSGVAAAVETSTLALGRGLLLASDAIWFISQGVVANEIEAGVLRSIPLGATYLSGAVGMTSVRVADLPAFRAAPLLALMQKTRQAAGRD